MREIALLTFALSCGADVIPFETGEIFGRAVRLPDAGQACALGEKAFLADGGKWAIVEPVAFWKGRIFIPCGAVGVLLGRSQDENR